MSPHTIPAGLEDLLTTDVLGHVTAINPDGDLVSYILWVDCADGKVLTSSPLGSAKGRYFRNDPRVSISVVDKGNPWRWLTISGRVTDIRPDDELRCIDKLSNRYLGTDYRRRESPREIFVIEPDAVRSSEGRG